MRFMRVGLRRITVDWGDPATIEGLEPFGWVYGWTPGDREGNVEVHPIRRGDLFVPPTDRPDAIPAYRDRALDHIARRKRR